MIFENFMFDRATDRLCLPARRRAVSERRAIVAVVHRPVADRLPSTVHDSTRAKMPATGKNARDGQKCPRRAKMPATGKNARFFSRPISFSGISWCHPLRVDTLLTCGFEMA